MICYECMEPFKWLIEDKGVRICQPCYHRRYSRKKYVNENYKNPNWRDVKRHLEKDW